MKTIIIYAIISFIGNIDISLAPINWEYSMPIEVIYGRGYDCQGRGAICNIKEANLSTPTNSKLFFDQQGNPLYIEILKSSLTAEEIVDQFSDDIIFLDKTFSFSQNRSTDNLKSEIKSGSYPIQADEFSYRITISSTQ